MRYLLAVFILLISAAQLSAAPNTAPLERGTAITDPAALRALDQTRFALARLLAPSRQTDRPLTGAELFALPSMRPIRGALDAEFDSYIARHHAERPNETIGVGSPYDFQLFDRAPLYSDQARFMLAGIVNRLDRGYVSEANCGEVRLIYRLVRTDIVETEGEDAISARLPMTLNIVLKAKADHDLDGDLDDLRDVSCAEIARRWLAAGDLALTGTALAEKLSSKDGPLDLIRPEIIDRIETNLQIAHAPKSKLRDFRTDYLFKVFDYHAASHRFEQAPLENQIDRDRLLADAKLGAEFKAWLLDPVHVGELDRGTILIPDQFLATGAVAATPVGFAASGLQPAFGLVARDGAAGDALFTESDVVTALQRATDSGVSLRNIRSLAGFERRLNDMTCSGCHQTRGIGGFHFAGVDWLAPHPDNSLIVPASPHFFADQVRRRDILIALRDGRPPDYARGFSARAPSRGFSELAGTEYGDGWGAHCQIPPADAAAGDPSFTSWNCAKGLACQVVDKASPIGMCFIASH